MSRFLHWIYKIDTSFKKRLLIFRINLNTIVFVTHDVEEAVFLADKIVLLDKNPGKIAEVIPVDLERPRKRDSMEFLKIQESIVENLDMEE